jgi:hypothetical protein
MAGGALLPGSMSGMLPDQAIENWTGTTYQAGSALAESVAESIRGGQLNTDAIDDFAERIVDRPGHDPFKGIGQTAQLAGEEWARADGSVTGVMDNLAGDVQRILETGAGADVLNETMGDFQQEVASGQHGTPLQGLDHVARIAADLAVEPTTTLGQFAHDVQNIYTHGVGDGYWQEAGSHAIDVVERTPLLGNVTQGYKELATGIGESGVGGFAQEMGEGAMALAGEGFDAVSSAASNTLGYLSSFFGD